MKGRKKTPPRTADWNDHLARQLRDPKFCREFILAAVDDGLPIQAILGKVIRAYGVNDFARKVGMPSSNLVRAMNPKHNPTLSTLNKILKSVGLEVSISRVRRSEAA